MSPVLHSSHTGLYNPLTDITLGPEDPAYITLAKASSRPAALARLSDSQLRRLQDQGWVHPADEDVWHRYLLRIVSLETHTWCNQRCRFCPVATLPRARQAMPEDLFFTIVEQLAAHRETIRGVFLNNYNEPTLDLRLGRFCRELARHSLPVALNTNGTGLVPRLVDELVAVGPIRYLCVNLTTLDPAVYRWERGRDHLATVLRNLDYAKDQPIAEEMVIVVLGEQDLDHQDRLAALRRRFRGTRFEVRECPLMDRVGYIEVGERVADPGAPLAGCDNLGSRPFQHLHISPTGRCLLCCQDYGERYVVGDLTRQTVEEVLSGGALACYRRWIYGAEVAPDDFICRRCTFAIRR